MTKSNDELKAIELLPCPFCGGMPLTGENHGVYTVCCENDNCSVKASVDGFSGNYSDYKELTDAAWNTRANVTPTDTSMEDAVTREDTVCASTHFISSSTTDGDAERALEAFNNAMSEPMNGKEQHSARYHLAVLATHCETIRTALQSTRKPPVQDELIAAINIKREVLMGVRLMGVRLSLCIARRDFKNWLSNQDARDAAIASVDKALATLDAVLAEGER